MSDIYRELVIDHYKNPRNVGEMSDASIHGHEDNTLCGDSIDFFIKFSDANLVEKVLWKGNGCALSQAAASLVSEKLKGKTRAEVQAFSDDDILEILGTSLNPSRKKCATLAVSSIKRGLKK